MKSTRSFYLLLACALSLFSSTAMAQQPTIGDAQGDFAAGNYRASLQKISRLLTGPTARPGSPQRYELLMLRGECMLQLKEANLAADAFDSAARSVKGEGDLKKLAAARAVAILIRESPGLTYKSKGRDAGAGTINIVPQTSRATAMAALLENRMTALKPELAQAIAGTSLVPMQKLLPALTDLYALELAATGDTARTTPLAREVGERARTLITAELDRLGKRTDELRDLASEPTFTSSGRNNDTVGYRGLTSSERDELKSIAQTLVQIERVAQEGRRINRRLGGTGETWDAILAECSECKRHAQDAFDRRY